MQRMILIQRKHIFSSNVYKSKTNPKKAVIISAAQPLIFLAPLAGLARLGGCWSQSISSSSWLLFTFRDISRIYLSNPADLGHMYEYVCIKGEDRQTRRERCRHKFRPKKSQAEPGSRYCFQSWAREEEKIRSFYPEKLALYQWK